MLAVLLWGLAIIAGLCVVVIAISSALAVIMTAPDDADFYEDW